MAKKEYERLVKATPIIDYTQLSKYETEDMTAGAKEAACVGGSCEIDYSTGSAVI